MRNYSGSAGIKGRGGGSRNKAPLLHRRLPKNIPGGTFWVTFPGFGRLKGWEKRWQSTT